MVRTYRFSTMVSGHVSRCCLGAWLLLAAAAAPAAQGGVEAGVAAYKRGDYERALSVFRPLARQGVPRAQAILGLMYSYGEGVGVDHAQAARWYREAAEQSYPVAQYNLGMLYIEGKGVERDLDEGVKWLERAAAGGHFRARSALRDLDRVAHDALPPRGDDALAIPPSTLAEETDAASAQTGAAKASTGATNAALEPPRSVVLSTSRSAAPPVPTAVEMPATSPVTNDPTPAPDSTPLAAVYEVQLAASRSEELIERDWSAAKRAHPDLLGELEGSIERAEIGEEKTVWYRLRVGPFATKSQAEGLCERLGERGVNVGCLPLRTRP